MEIPDFDVFMSYNSGDEAPVRQLADRLRQQGIAPWMAPDGIPPGLPWASVLDAALDRGIGCAICIGPHGLGKWQELEYQSAVARFQTDRTYRVVPVLLPGSDDYVAGLPQLMRRFQRIDFRGGLDDGQALRSLIQAFQRTGPSPRDANPALSDHEECDSVAFTSREGNGATAMAAAQVSRLSENTQTLQQYIKDMTFTPIIGYGCSLVGRSRGLAWRRIADEMQTLLSHLSPDEPASMYVRRLAATPVYEVPLDDEVAEPGESAPERPLVRLQIVLARLGAQLGVVFASAMLESGTPVWDTPTYRLPIAADNSALQAALDLLFDACLAAYALQKAEGMDTANGLEPHGICERLIELTADLAPDVHAIDRLGRISPSSNGHDVVERIRDRVRASFKHRPLREDAPEHGVDLALHQLEWIADALWHTFRYDKPAYPRADELAFQISLLARGARGRRPELAQAAQIGRNHLDPSIVAAWFQRYSQQPPDSMHEFYDVLARVLYTQHKRFEENPQIPKPIQAAAFTTNYDLEMESAFQRVGDRARFHVAIPVLAYRDEPDENAQADAEPMWLLGTHYGGAVDEPKWTWFTPKMTLLPDEIEGPILVKLHGSPLHRLPDPRRIARGGATDAIPDYKRIRHALVLSEREYMDNIVWRDPLPKYFSNLLLQPQRTMFFLGQSLSQWGTRLRIYSHIYRPGGNLPASSSRYAIGRSANPYRAAVLGAIGVSWWIGELEEIPDAVESVLDYQ